MARGKETGQETRFFLTWIPYEQVRYNSSWGGDTKTRLCHLWQICMLQPVRIYFLSWLLAGNYYMVTLRWCLTYTLIYLLVTHPPLTLLMWVLESQWLFTNMCSFLVVMWTCWAPSTSPILIYSSAWLIPHHALLIFLLFYVTSTCTSDIHSTVALLFLRVYKSVSWLPVASDLTSFIVLLYFGRSQ